MGTQDLPRNFVNLELTVAMECDVFALQENLESNLASQLTLAQEYVVQVFTVQLVALLPKSTLVQLEGLERQMV